LQIDAFQNKADDFFSGWLDLVGYDGITNYIHLLGAGHIRYFLKKWRNLHRFSNQGWEAYNALLANYWHHRTQKGGGRGVEKSKILAIAQWLMRVMMWRTAEGDHFFKVLRKSNENEECSECSDDDDDDDDCSF